ncbi:MAG: DUF952 domain-containing protein [Austwickia sp.]|nr:DUF952 domain-containing protein [Actinomycetota bacterium]MCB1254459.1 DUF952 domain-containing protein [Austwickia sp.]MCO5309573.1 DUF952 domain-containing protein [Austwickia sp.]
MSVWHLALASDWRAALADGSYPMSTRGATIDQVGYLHGSRDLAQADAVARRFYADVAQPLVLLEIDESRLTTYGLVVRLEPADPALPPAAGGELFPHVYGGPLPVAAVCSVRPYVVPADPDGSGDVTA